MARFRTNKRRDKRAFKKLANKTNKLNTGKIVYRGGIRF